MYHAGGEADVHKHRILTDILYELAAKERPISYMETHAGRGIYDLDSLESKKTGEASLGIESFLKDPKNAEDPYGKLITSFRKRFFMNSLYPGSPFIAQRILSPKDEIFLMELHPKEVEILKDLYNFKGAKITVKHCDGFEGVLSTKPGKNHQIFVLIDPSYEIKTEYDLVANFIPKLKSKWPEAIIMLWYPILSENFHVEMLKKIPDKNRIIDEVTISTPKNRNWKGMIGSGVMVIR